MKILSFFIFQIINSLLGIAKLLIPKLKIVVYDHHTYIYVNDILPSEVTNQIFFLTERHVIKKDKKPDNTFSKQSCKGGHDMISNQ